MVILAGVNDRYDIKVNDVEDIVRELSVSYAHLHRFFRKNKKRVDSTLARGNLTNTVQLLTDIYQLPHGFVRRVGYAAKIDFPASLQSEYSDRKVVACTMLFREAKSTLQKIPPYRFLHFTAHELAHARMGIDTHRFRKSEFATDVLALLVTGNRHDYLNSMMNDRVMYGYIRHDLLPEVFRCIALYRERIYLPDK